MRLHIGFALCLFLSAIQLAAQVQPGMTKEEASTTSVCRYVGGKDLKIDCPDDMPWPPPGIFHVQTPQGLVKARAFRHKGRDLWRPEFTFREVADRGYWVAVAASVGSCILDVESSQRALRRGGMEANPVFGRHPSRAKMYSVMLPINTLGNFLLYYNKKTQMQNAALGRPRPRLSWKFTAMVAPAMHIGAAAYNLSLSPRSRNRP